MRLRPSRRSLAALVLLLGSRANAAQEPEATDPRTFLGSPFLSLSELVLERYAVQNVDAGELALAARSLLGRDFFVKENGAGSKPVTSLRQLGDTIVIYDTKENVQRARELLARMDAPRETPAPSKVVEYRPRFVSLHTVAQAVDDFVDFNLVEERGMIVMSDDQASVDQALSVLTRIDVAEKQVLLTCLLVDVGASAHGLALPRDLGDNLRKLLPEVEFAQVGMAMLKTSVSSQSPVSVQIESPGKRYQFSLIPIAFDQATGTLSVSECRLTEGPDERVLFRTNTLLRGGEYTVLAATGDSPRLLVVRVTPQG